VIDIVKAIVKFDIDSFVVEEAPRVKARLEHAEEMKKFQEKRSKKK